MVAAQQMDAKDKAAYLACMAYAEAIRELGSVPSGHLYSYMQGVVSLDTHQTIVASLVRSGLIANKGHLLVWIGPKE